MHACLCGVYFEPLTLDRSGAVTVAWTMYEQAPEKNLQQHPHGLFRFPGAASSCTFSCPPVQHKSKRLQAGSGQLTTKPRRRSDNSPVYNEGPD